MKVFPLEYQFSFSQAFPFIVYYPLTFKDTEGAAILFQLLFRRQLKKFQKSARNIFAFQTSKNCINS